MIGGHGEKYLLRCVAEHADWWNYSFRDMPTYVAKQEALKRHCRDVKRDYARAIDCFKKAIELEPSFPEYRASLGYTLGLDGKREEGSKFVRFQQTALGVHDDHAKIVGLVL